MTGHRTQASGEDPSGAEGAPAAGGEREFRLGCGSACYLLATCRQGWRGCRWGGHSEDISVVFLLWTWRCCSRVSTQEKQELELIQTPAQEWFRSLTHNCPKLQATRVSCSR